MIQSGIISKTIYRDEVTGYTIASLYTGNGFAKVKGVMPRYLPHTPLTIACEPVEENQETYNITSIKEEAFSSRDALKFLKNTSLLGERASEAVNSLKNDLFEECRNGNLAKILKEDIGIDESNTQRIINAIMTPIWQRELYEYLNSNKIFVPFTTIEASIHEHGDMAMGLYPHHFHINSMTRLGISFENAQKLAENRRARASELEGAIYELLSKAEKNGSTYMDVTWIIRRLHDRYKIDANRLEVRDAISYSPELCFSDEIHIARRSMARAETTAARKIQEMKRQPLISNERLKEEIEKIEADLKIKYAPQQKASFNLLRTTGLVIVTGGPGTGKTTVVNGLIRAFEACKPESKIQLAAPTGRAAQRITESTGRVATTIHKMIGLDSSGRTAVNVVDADLLVIDEASMIDTNMLSALMSVVKETALVILVGDIDQLPSVGAGDVLRDLISSGEIPYCKLETVFRQGQQSPIVMNANRINHGKTTLQLDSDFTVHECTREDIVTKVIDAVQAKWDPENPFDTQVLCPAHKGIAGIEAINQALQNLLNPKRPHEAVVYAKKTEYRVRDKVIMMVNNYEHGYSNGDVGIIQSIDESVMTIDIGNRTIDLERSKITDVSLAYCISIHKSQGSEFKNAIVVLSNEQTTMLKRNLLYTAVTRAKKTCSIIAEKGTVQKSILTNDTCTRNTRLKSLLNQTQTEERVVMAG